MKKVFGYGVVIGFVWLAIAGSAGGGNATYGGKENTEVGVAPRSMLTGRITGKVKGVFNRNCLICDTRLKRLIKTSSVWCGWQNGKVIVHVTMRNTAVEHVTVNWHPSYIIARGGEHGQGLGSTESSGFDAGELRQLFAKEDPKGVKDGSKIAKCKPSFSTIQSG